MIVAFFFRQGSEARPELCVFASKPDGLSVPVNIDSIPVTESAVVRLGPQEGVLAELDPSDNGKILTPVTPSKMYLTPSQPDRPGVIASRVKVVKFGDGDYDLFFMRDKDTQWRPWNPLKVDR